MELVVVGSSPTRRNPIAQLAERENVLFASVPRLLFFRKE